MLFFSTFKVNYYHTHMNVICRIKNQMLRDYLSHLFPTKNGAFCIDRNTDVGKFICALVKVSDLPVNQDIDSESVQFILPTTSHLPELFRKFCYLDQYDQKRIEDYLASWFNLDYGMFYLFGRQQNIQEKEVILNFILDRKLDSMIGDPETLKKRKYREYDKTVKKIHQRLRMRAYNMNKSFTAALNAFQNTLKHE